MMLIVDRIENGQAVCETGDGSFQNIPLSRCTGPVCEGDVLRKSGGGYEVDREETEKRREKIRRMSRDLFR
ncbi:MAG: DUF3006 domain-containing protein [Oscillospiraceae bacterium]|jgi:hypothetical protein